jgi:hypothetical protein
MDSRVFAQCVSMLKAMNSQQLWDDGHRQLYGLVLVPLDDEVGRAAVVHAATHLCWRPSPADLRRIAADIASPLPDDATCYAEIMHMAERHGVYAMPDPGRPSVLLEGPPAFSHPIVGRIVALCGGWRMICSGEAGMQEGMRKQVRGAHESVCDRWREEVARQLELAADRRDPALFRRYEPFCLPAPDVRTKTVEAHRPVGGVLPERVRRLVGQVGHTMPQAVEVRG